MPLEYKGSLSRYRRYLQTVKDRPLVRASLWVAFSLILTTTMILTALKPTLTTISALIGQIEQEEKISAQLDEKIRAVQMASRNLDQIQEKLPILEETMPDDPKWKDLAIRLEKEASESGVVLENLSIEKIPIKGKYTIDKTTTVAEEKIELPVGVQKVDIDIQVNGQYDQFKELISRLEKLRRIIVISSSSINKDENGKLTLVITGYAIFSNIKEEL